MLSTPVIPSAPTSVYIDMEGDPQAKFVYLIGLHIVTGNQDQFYSLWADDKKDEKGIFNQCFQLLGGLGDMQLYHYGSYEARVFKRMLPFAPTGALAKLLEENTTNVLEHVYSNIYFPTYSNSLKDIGPFLGHKWSTDSATGLSAIMWRKRWSRTRRPRRLVGRRLRYGLRPPLRRRPTKRRLESLPETTYHQLLRRDHLRFNNQRDIPGWLGVLLGHWMRHCYPEGESLPRWPVARIMAGTTAASPLGMAEMRGLGPKPPWIRSELHCPFQQNSHRPLHSAPHRPARRVAGCC